MDSSFGEGYISQVKQRQGEDSDTATTKNAKVVTVAGDVALDQLLNILIVLNGGLLIIIPIASWFLAKRTLSPVQKIHEQQKQFVSDASHEMRTPLAIMSGEIEITLNKKRTTEEYKKTLISTKEETNRLSKLVENLLFLANADRNEKTLTLELIDITDVISDVVQSLQLKSNNKNIALTLHTDNVTTPMVHGHPTLLHQLFYNLIDNAIIYTPKKGKVTISLSELKNFVSIAIVDTGIGIGHEHQTKITQRFYRIDTARSQTKGYGLGLSIVKSIIERHKGQLRISSKVNKGSTFTVLLPKI